MSARYNPPALAVPSPGWDDLPMADSDDIDKLLAEIDAMNRRTGAAPVPGAKPGVPATQSAPESGSDRAKWTAASALGAGVTGLVAGTVLTFLPYVGGIQTGIGAALGGAVVGFISGPPKWFQRK